MTATLPVEVQQVFDRFITTEYTTVDATASRSPGPSRRTTGPAIRAIDITTGLGYPKKAEDARRNPHVSLLFSDPTGSRIERPPAVLVQGTATVDDADLEANRERYARESIEKLPATKEHVSAEVRPAPLPVVLRAHLREGPPGAGLRLAGGRLQPRADSSSTRASRRSARATPRSRRFRFRRRPAARPRGTTACASSAASTRRPCCR